MIIVTFSVLRMSNISLQSPKYSMKRDEMFCEIYRISPCIEDTLTDNPLKVFAWPLGADIVNVTYA